MHSKNPKQRLYDILDNVEAILRFSAGMTFEQFAADQKTVYAIIRALEIISEACRRLPEELKGRHPQVDWIAVAAAGNVYRHEYDVVDNALIWRTVQHGLTLLRQVAETEIRRLGETGVPGA